MKYICRMLGILLLAMPEFLPASTPPAKVMVLATLHQLHAKVPGYGFDDLGKILDQLHPDVLCLEVGAKDLVARPVEGNKQEYQMTIYPFVDRGHYRIYPLEPSEPVYSTIVRPYARANRDFADAEPSKARALSSYIDGIYAVLMSYWTSPSRVNDAVTDEVLRAKHALQEAMIGSPEETGWRAWNQHFLEVVIQAARENPGKRIVITVGVEHAYWLRGHLAGVKGVDLLDPFAKPNPPQASPRSMGPFPEAARSWRTEVPQSSGEAPGL